MELLEVVKEALLLGGAEVEATSPAQVQVLAPKYLQEQLEIPEFCVMSFSGEETTGALPVNAFSSLVQHLPQVLGNKGLVLEIALPESMRPAAGRRDSDNLLLTRLLNFGNATFRFSEASAAWGVLHVGFFRYTAFSDDKRVGLVTVAINEDSQTYTELDESLFRGVLHADGLANSEGSQIGVPLAVEIERIIIEKLHSYACSEVKDRLNHFVQGMQRRMQRDFERLFEYYSELWSELNSAGKTARSTEAIQLKRQAIERDYNHKISDIRQHYSLSVNLEMVQSARLLVPLRRVAFEILRRKHRRTAHIDIHPLAEKPKALRCEQCFVSSKELWVQDENCAMLCRNCFMP